MACDERVACGREGERVTKMRKSCVAALGESDGTKDTDGKTGIWGVLSKTRTSDGSANHKSRVNKEVEFSLRMQPSSAGWGFFPQRDLTPTLNADFSPVERLSGSSPRSRLDHAVPC